MILVYYLMMMMMMMMMMDFGHGKAEEKKKVESPVSSDFKRSLDFMSFYHVDSL